MLQASLIRLREDEHILLINLHHIVSDGFSKGIMFRELAEFYGAFIGGRAPRLPELPIQYVDFAAWQRRRLEGAAYEALLATGSRSSPGRGAAGTAHRSARPPVQSTRGSQRRRGLPASLLNSLKELSRQHKATLFMTLLAAYKAFLHRYTGQEDLAGRDPIADRDRPEVASLMGFFINTLVLRTDLWGDPTFRGLIDRVRQTSLAAYDHQDMPFEKLVMELRPERDLSYTPLIQSLFSVGHVKGGHVQDLVPELPRLDHHPPAGRPRNVQVRLHARPHRGTGLADHGLRVQHRPVRFRDGRPDARALRVLSGGPVADPDCRISRLPLMSEVERHRVLVEWDETHAAREARRERPPVVRGAGGAVPRGDRRGRPGAILELRGAQCQGQPARSSPEAARGRPGCPGGDLHREEPRAGRRDPGRAQGRRDVLPPRPRLSSRSACLHDRRLAGPGTPDARVDRAGIARALGPG